MDLALPTGQEDLLRIALKQVLACPGCRGPLGLDPKGESLRCGGCGASAPLLDGIPLFRGPGSSSQAEERAFRDRAASEQMRLGAADLLGVVGRHHCIPLMEKCAQDFRRRFPNQGWLLDIGTGYAWHWRDGGPGPLVVGMDFSLGNLRLANRLLGQRRRCVLLICADASRLPLAAAALDGVWSVQTFQHFTEPVFRQALAELDRILKKDFLIELHHLHPAMLYRILCRLRGRRLHRRGRSGPFETHRLEGSEWRSRWEPFRGGRFEAALGYSELFFHPELGLRPRPYPVGLDRFLSRRAPWLASCFARQGTLCMANRF